MEAYIVRELSLFSKGQHPRYDVYIDRVNTYYIQMAEMSLLYNCTLYVNNSNDTITPRITIKRIAPIITNFRLIVHGGSRFLFDCISFWSGHYQCLAGNDRYDIYLHAGLNCSVFKNGIQVASWRYATVFYLPDGNIRRRATKMVANKDCDIELLLAYYIAVNRIKLYYYRLLPETMPFDVSWQPH